MIRVGLEPMTAGFQVCGHARCLLKENDNQSMICKHPLFFFGCLFHLQINERETQVALIGINIHFDTVQFTTVGNASVGSENGYHGK